jgi:large subunit ribosomal protein L21e
VALSGKADTKRKPVGPRDGFVLPNVTAQTVTPLPYDILREGVKY